MIDSLFFDSDCISAFLWVNEQNLIALLYPGMVVIPKPAYNELSYPTTPHLKQRIDYLINNNQATLEAIHVDSDAYALYQKLTTSPDEGHKVIGPGEAAPIALAKGYTTEDDGNTIWISMLAKRRKLGAASFSEYIKSKK
ncbi:MAG TPA: hypothetical protein DDX29_10520 [Clostridiales bacterium]|nr:hypothetical protein [Clostridiales bacterium]